jgi:hypothetical protein
MPNNDAEKHGPAFRPPVPGGVSVAEQWLNKVVYTFKGEKGQAEWTVRDAVEGLQVFGATGSGKTSGSGRAIATNFLRLGFGGIVLTSKPDEVQNWVDYFEASGRPMTDLLILEPAGTKPKGSVTPTSRTTGKPLDQATHFRHAINLMEYEYLAGGGMTHNVVTLLLNAVSANASSASGVDPFWNESLRELLTHAIDLCAKGSQLLDKRASIQIGDIIDVVRSAPHRREEAFSKEWQDPTRSRCWQLVDAVNKWAVVTPDTDPSLRDFVQTGHYWMQGFPSLADRTRSIVVSSLTGKISGLTRAPLYELFCDKTHPDLRPETTQQGKVIVVNLPVKLYGEVGRIAQILYKTIWQRATERRISTINSSGTGWVPVFLWADESQYFVSPEDMLYQQTARAAFGATVYLTQNISNYYAAMGGKSGEASVDSLLGNLQTKIFHSNGDAATNQWAEKLFGSQLTSAFTSQGDKTSSSEQWWPRVPAARFTMLKKGGKDRTVKGVFFQPGRQYAIPNQNHLDVTFEQTPQNP